MPPRQEDVPALEIDGRVVEPLRHDHAVGERNDDRLDRAVRHADVLVLSENVDVIRRIHLRTAEIIEDARLQRRVLDPPIVSRVKEGTLDGVLPRRDPERQQQH